MTVNLQRRKSVMARSMRLGHCVCNPKQPCPCELFRSDNICECAGERRPPKSGPVRLTRHVRKAGCASKIGQADLLRILGNLPPVTDPNVLVGSTAGDDAGVYRLGEGEALVQTVDVFTPCVDDAYLFGQIAAANSISDCYAMGATPLTALSVACFPIDTLDGSVLETMLRGGIDNLNEAGCPVIGGHSVNDEEVKLGFAVTGRARADAVVERGRAQVGDLLVLTKPLGTGMVSFGAQMGAVSDECLREVGESMATLNRDAAELMVHFGAHACTDVTGFGLAGHLVEMARGSSVTAEVDMSALPVFSAAAECMERGIIGGAVERNQEYAMAWVRAKVEGGEDNFPILYDPQTSGGLLISLPENEAGELVEEMRARGHDATNIIGRVIENPQEKDGEVVVIHTGLDNLVGLRGGVSQPTGLPVAETSATCCEPEDPEPPCCCDAAPDDEAPPQPEATCCASPPGNEAAPPSDFPGPERFTDFMRAVNAPGAIDARQKKLMAVALSVAQRCEECIEIQIQGALGMGISAAEIDEAAWLGIAFAGAPAMMLYQRIRKSLDL